MIDLESFRLRTRKWLAANAARFEGSDPMDLQASRIFRGELWEAGLLGITLDLDYGGQGLTAEHQRVFTEELSRYSSLPATGHTTTTGICAPTLLDFGSEDQKRRHVARMIRGDELWAQLLSEPGAGSDLAALQTRAVRDGDTYLISGQKVWTSGALQADYALCMARTNLDVPKHQGLSMFIVDLDLTGITIRPLRQMTGDARFNEVFLDEVRVPIDNLVGAENDGWRALTAMLTHERLAVGAGTGAGGSGQAWATLPFAQLVNLARIKGSLTNPVTRQELVRVYMAERILAFVAQRMRDEIVAGAPPGSKGSLAKLATTMLSAQSASLGAALSGAAAQAWDPADPDGSVLAHAVCLAPMRGIAGGTSEIQRNTIGERVLGLPKDPQLDRHIPFRDMLRNPT